MKNKSKFQNKLNKKKICILSDCFVPTRNSASGMIYNLSKHFLDQGAIVTCLHSGHNPRIKPEIFQGYDIKDINFITTDLFISFRNKNIFLRFFFEIFLALILSLKLIKHYNVLKKIDILIWYGPSAFLWLPALLIKTISGCPLYYILRDIFPDWLYSIGVIRNKLLFLILKLLTYPQYILPNKIGIESPENFELIPKYMVNKNKIEVLYNWPSLNYNKEFINQTKEHKSKNISNIKGIYSGNFGFAQDSKNVKKFLLNIKKKSLLNIDFFTKNFEDEKELSFKNPVSEKELIVYFQRYQFGVLSLNVNLITNNIPGKFVSYTQYGLPILCFANVNSTIAKLVIDYNCGVVVDFSNSITKNLKIINNFLKIVLNKNNFYSKNSKKVHTELFKIENVKHKIEDLI